MATNEALRSLDQAVIMFCILIMIFITVVFIRRQYTFPSILNIFGGLSSFCALIISITASIYIFDKTLPCDVRAYLVSTLYALSNIFLFCHFLAKSRLLVGVIPDDDGGWEVVIKNFMGKGRPLALRGIDVVFLVVILFYILTAIVGLPFVTAKRSSITGLCTIGKPGLAQFLNVALVITGNFMCLFAFVIPLHKLVQRSKSRSIVARSLDRQKRLVLRTCIAIAVSITSLIVTYSIMLASSDSILATYYIDMIITQSGQLMSIIPPKESSNARRIAIMSTQSIPSKVAGSKLALWKE